MKVINTLTAPAKDLTAEKFMIGGGVEVKFLIGSDIAEDLDVGIVKFKPGARTNFHVHKCEQVLYCLEGKGILATEKEEVVVTPGMIIFFPKGEKHYHGATRDSSFAHLSILSAHDTPD